MKKLIAAVAILVSSLAAQAQRQQPPAEQPKLIENIDVRVVNIDVVVTDKKGVPVQGLTKDDFELLENGKPKPISNFYEVQGTRTIMDGQETTEAAPAPAPAAADQIPDQQKRRIILYIDNLSLAPFNRNRVFKDMKEFVAKVMRPGDEAMIATFNRSMKVRVPFSRDPVHIQQTLDAIAGESALGGTNVSDRRSTEGQIRDAQSYDMALAAARAYSESVQHDLRQSAESLKALMSTVAGVEGKKILVLTSEGFPMQPGREVFAYLEEISREKGWITTAALEAMGYNSHQTIRSIAESANANGITLYTIHAGGLGAGTEMSAENARAISLTVSQAAVTNSTDSMQMMAEVTGGVASLQTNNFAAAFEKIRRDLESYYSLGYRAGTERVDRQRSIEVKVKRKGLLVRSRQSFVEKSTYAEMNDRVIANLLYGTKQNDLKIIARTGRPVATDDNDLFRVPLEVQIPMDTLTLIPQGDTEYAGGFDVYVAVANSRNDLSDVARQSHQLRIPVADMPRAKGRFYTYSLELLMERGLNRISVGVVDNVSNVVGFAKDQVIAQDLR